MSFMALSLARTPLRRERASMSSARPSASPRGIREGEENCSSRTNGALASPMFALTQGLRRAVQTKPNGTSTHFASRRRTWQQTIDRVSRIAGALSALGVRPRRPGRHPGAEQRPLFRADVRHPLDRRGHGADQHAAGGAGDRIHPVRTRAPWRCSSTPPWSHHLTRARGQDARRARGRLARRHRLGPEGMLHFEDLTNYEPAARCRRGQRRPRRPLLHRRHDRPLQGRDAHPHQPGGERAERRSPASASPPTRPTSIPAPMFHLADGASTFGVTMAGGRHAFVPRFEPVEVLQTIQTEKVTHAQFVPTMINMIVNHPRFAEFDISHAAVHPLRRLADARGRAAQGHAGDAACAADARLRHDRGGADRDPARPALHHARRAVRRQAEVVRPGGAGLRGQGGRRQRARKCRAARRASSRSAAPTS